MTAPTAVGPKRSAGLLVIAGRGDGRPSHAGPVGPKRLAALLVVGLAVVGACGDGGRVEIGGGSPPPAPTATPAPEPQSPAAEAAGELRFVEVAPAPEPVPPEPPAAELFDGDEESDSPAGSEPEDGLDEAAVADLVAGVLKSQSGVTSSSEQVYLTIRTSFDDEFDVNLDDVPYALATTVGDRTHIRIDQAALAGLDAAEDGTAPAVPADMPPLEAIFDQAAQQVFFRLAPLAALEPEGDRAELAQGLAAQGFDIADIADLWGTADLADQTDWLLTEIGVSAVSLLEEFLELLQVASSSGSILEADAVGPSEAAGVATEEYVFVIDLAPLADQLPPFFAAFLGELDGSGSEGGGLLDGLGVPLPVGYAVHLDPDGLARQVVIDLDLGAILSAVFEEFAEFGEPSATDGPADGAQSALFEIEYRIAVRIEVLAVNDPSLAVALPDPALVVELP